MKIKNLEKFIRKIQKYFSKAGITTVIEKSLPKYYRDGLHHCDITIYSTYFDTQKHLIEALRLIATSSCKVR